MATSSAGTPLDGRPGWNKGRTFPRDVLSVDEIHALMDAFPGGYTGDRSRAIVALMAQAGLRASEAFGAPARGKRTTPIPPLRAKDIDTSHRVIALHDAKGNKSRTVGVPESALLHVERWITRRKDMGLSPSAPLFCQRDGTPVTRQAFAGALSRAASKTTIAKRVHPHGLRRSHAATLAWAGVPMHAIQAQLGHESLETTARYLGTIAPTELAAAVASVQWEPAM